MKERKEKQESKAEDENEKGDDFVLAWQ
jgi:hypothetical protein